MMWNNTKAIFTSCHSSQQHLSLRPLPNNQCQRMNWYLCKVSKLEERPAAETKRWAEIRQSFRRVGRR